MFNHCNELPWQINLIYESDDTAVLLLPVREINPHAIVFLPLRAVLPNLVFSCGLFIDSSSIEDP